MPTKIKCCCHVFLIATTMEVMMSMRTNAGEIEMLSLSEIFYLTKLLTLCITRVLRNI